MDVWIQGKTAVSEGTTVRGVRQMDCQVLRGFERSPNERRNARAHFCTDNRGIVNKTATQKMAAQRQSICM